MYYLYNDHNSTISNMAFEKYVILVIGDYLSSQGKTIRVGAGVNFDAVLPDGVDEIPGPVYLEVKSTFANKNAYFRSIEHYASRLRDIDNGTLMFVLGDRFTDESKQSLKRLSESRAKIPTLVWDIDDFNEKTKDYQMEYRDFTERPAKAIVEDVINNHTSEEQFEQNRDRLINEVKQVYKDQELVLFLGAGVSVDAGIPKWSELINLLLSEMILKRAKGEPEAQLSEHLPEMISLAYKNREDSPITQMRYIRGAFDSEEYLRLVHDVLYRNRPKPNTELLDSIAEICTPRRHHMGVQGVVTYNFDDLLERRLSFQKVLTNTISNEDDISGRERLSIFHVHGYLPLDSHDSGKDTELIFSEEDYHRVYRDVYCWSNLAQLNYLRDKTCLFIGCSLTDPNLRRLLDVATRNNEKPRHYAFLRRNHAIDAAGINRDAIDAYKRIDMSIREKYYATMGLNIIWIDRFEEIPRILKRFLP